MLVFIRKSCWICKNSICTSKLCSTVIHHLYKSVHRAPDMFGKLKCDIVGGTEHDRIEALFYSKNLIQLGGNICTAIGNTGHTGCCHGNLIRELTVLQGKKSCHNLDSGTGIKYLIHIFRIKKSLCGVLHDHSSGGSDLRALRPSGNTVGGYGRGICLCICGCFFRCKNRCLEH